MFASRSKRGAHFQNIPYASVVLDNTGDELDDKYEQQKIIGVGVYGTVFKGRDRKTGRTVAIKRLRHEADLCVGIPADVLREVNCLMGLARAPGPSPGSTWFG